MRKVLSLFIAWVMLMGLVSMAQAEEKKILRLEGTITEMKEDGNFLMNSISQGPVLVLVNAETILDAQKALAAGQYVIIEYDVATSKSLPPQVTALRIGCYVIHGTVQSVDAAASTALVDSKDFSLVLVHLPAMETALKAGDYVAVYFSGVMALSYPGQAGGLKVDIYEKVQGTIMEIGEGYLLMEGEAEEVHVNMGEETSKPVELKTGDKVTVYYLGGMTRSLPPQVFGDIIEFINTAK